MKRFICALCVLFILISAVGCSSENKNVIDLTDYDERLTYLEVTKMVEDPKEYNGKKITLNGIYTVILNQITGEKMSVCAVTDATACCTTYLEIAIAEGVEPPAVNTRVTITGEFETYKLITTTYGRLANTTFVSVVK